MVSPSIILKRNGDIIFNYKKLPYYPGNRTIKEAHGEKKNKKYPIIMGIEDAVIVRQNNKNILADYAPLDLNVNLIYHLLRKYGGATVYAKARRTCPEFESCLDCVEYTKTNGFLKCGWCQEDNICADKMGRESASLSAGCLADGKLLYTKEMCERKPSESEEKKYIYVVIGIIIVLCLASICVYRHIYKLKGELAKYSSGIPQDEMAANASMSVPGQLETHEHDELSA